MAAACAVAAVGLGAGTPAPAVAATTSRPIAIGVATDGTSYVGFASGGALARLDMAGDPLPDLPLDRSGPVDGLAVTPGGNVWVYYGDALTRLAPDGTVLAHFGTDPAGGCGPTESDPARYGGIAATSTRVYVAARCAGDLEVYGNAGMLQARVDLPGTTAGSAVAFGPAQSGGAGARVVVAMPDTGRLLAYDADSLAAGSSPTLNVRLATPGGGTRPEPSGVAANEFGQVVALDAANNAVYYLDANNGFSLYRTLGHPPEPSDDVGSLDTPRAIALHEQDGTSMSGNIVIADTGNGRVQRWDAGGFTYWAEDVDAPDAGPQAPVNTVRPVVSGTPAVGSALGCTTGSWLGAPSSYEWSWRRDGTPIDGATTATYVVTAADLDHDLTCGVRATNDVGTSAWAVSAPVTVGAPGSACPGPTGVTVDGGAAWTTTRAVTLRIRPPADATGVVIANDDGFEISSTQPLAADCRYDWTLAASGRPARVVHVRFTGTDPSPTVTDGIGLDTADPTLRRALARWSNRIDRWVLDVRAADAVSGVRTMTYAASRSGPARTVRVGVSVSTRNRKLIRWVRTTDHAGNISPWRRTVFRD